MAVYPYYSYASYEAMKHDLDCVWFIYLPHVVFLPLSRK